MGQIKRALRRRLRDGFVLVVSTAVVVAVMAYVVSPTEYRVRFDVDVHALLAASGPAASSSVIYGVVSDGDEGIEGATVEVTPEGGPTPVQRVVTAVDGTFRVEVPEGRFLVRISCEREGRHVSGHTSLDVEAERAYEVNAVVAEHNQFSVFPVSSY